MGATKKMFMRSRQVKCCQVCWHDNHRDNFICENCGFDFDLEITQNENGLPEINIK